MTKRKWKDPPKVHDYEKHALWPSFVDMINRSKIVRRDILQSHSANWLFIWHVFLAGAMAQKNKRGSDESGIF